MKLIPPSTTVALATAEALEAFGAAPGVVDLGIVQLLVYIGSDRA